MCKRVSEGRKTVFVAPPKVGKIDRWLTPIFDNRRKQASGLQASRKAGKARVCSAAAVV